MVSGHVWQGFTARVHVDNVFVDRIDRLRPPFTWSSENSLFKHNGIQIKEPCMSALEKCVEIEDRTQSNEDKVGLHFIYRGKNLYVEYLSVRGLRR